LKWLPLAASVAIAVPGLAQSPSVPPVQRDKTVEGATADRVTQINRCQGHKFESLVEIDPIAKRSTRVKLCANPGASDAAWVKTLESAILQIEDRDMPAAAKDKVIAELKAEIAKFATASQPLAITQGSSTLFGAGSANDSLIAPTERFETSTLPSLTPKKIIGPKGTLVAAKPRPRMAIRIKCLSRGETGGGSTCDFFDHDTVLAVSAVEGLEKGGMLRFLRRGDVHGETNLAPLAVGQSVRVKLPGDLCRGITYSKIEIELLPAAGGTSAARLGPYGLRC